MNRITVITIYFIFVHHAFTLSVMSAVFNIANNKEATSAGSMCLLVTSCLFLLSVGFLSGCVCWEVQGGAEDWNLGNVTLLRNAHLIHFSLL